MFQGAEPKHGTSSLFAIISTLQLMHNQEDHALTCSFRHLTTVASSTMELLPTEEPMSATQKGPVLVEEPEEMSLTAAISSCWAACRKAEA